MAPVVSTSAHELVELVERATAAQEEAAHAFDEARRLQNAADVQMAAVLLELAALIGKGRL